jgi:hypothetical protein
MEYVVTSTALYGKEPGAKITEKELLDVGANIQKYLQSGKLKEADAVSKVQQAVPQVQKEEPKAFVFKSDNNEQGDK